MIFMAAVYRPLWLSFRAKTDLGRYTGNLTGPYNPPS